MAGLRSDTVTALGWTRTVVSLRPNRRSSQELGTPLDSSSTIKARVGENSVKSVHSRWQMQVEVSPPQLFPQCAGKAVKTIQAKSKDLTRASLTQSVTRVPSPN